MIEFHCTSSFAVSTCLFTIEKLLDIEFKDILEFENVRLNNIAILRIVRD